MTAYDGELTVHQIATPAEGVRLLSLRHPLGDPLPAWEPGAHVDLLLAPGLERQYSLCGDPADRHEWRIAVLREVDGRGGSAYVHGELAPGDKVGIRGPRNNFPLLPAPRYRFVAGGIGITPLLPMLAAAEASGAEWTLLYGGRSRRSMAFTDQLLRYGDRVTVAPQDETGALLELGPVLDELPGDTLVYCCGPGPLLDAVESRCPSGALHVERFQPRTPQLGAINSEFEVVLERSGRTVTVGADVSVLDAVRAAGVEVLYSCTEGTCGTCETDVLEGAVDHRDSVLTAEEQEAGETMMICVSRCKGDRLVLDL
ncbi:PDR/VanB family oxidoreductase [Streptomyces acidiscabies]|uniref:PDR/VanB family oxidoreductase n=1 Tax=Streptomyces acidiscabies TaxID=42234 RepID=A0AAP6BAZ5_9ACTN|nr:PDR/VanB family oxidoreductase [Streptomyces acidiscabies]MBP5935650.1 oxidoreductase [Streptomyces sp. LBUM 1476]MBZ3916465.1 oxidoreductase [Streptomyces acidiscabies]MDX2961162.1 PDR/VanB family oxidoreductase [Streptomyces acidiscabies]MDX3022884.1 PDR/VanB family oxidoreductase [Streptomyces acidiscabies]MDX3791869.1 PDR/VanB family oxidoreductase [Streptomyces acidiscabies]